MSWNQQKWKEKLSEFTTNWNEIYIVFAFSIRNISFHSDMLDLVPLNAFYHCYQIYMEIWINQHLFGYFCNLLNVSFKLFTMIYILNLCYFYLFCITYVFQYVQVVCHVYIVCYVYVLERLLNIYICNLHSWYPFFIVLNQCKDLFLSQITGNCIGCLYTLYNVWLFSPFVIYSRLV